MRVNSSTKKTEVSGNPLQPVRKNYFSKSDFHKFLASGRVSDLGDKSDVVDANLELIKKLSRFDIGDYVIVTTFKDDKYQETRGKIVGYKKPPDFVMGIQEERKKRVTNIDINPCGYGFLSDLEYRSSRPRIVWVELLNIKTGEVPLHILKDWSMSSG